ncbi:MAG TPA: helix-turn-helix domain-containing protein [Actinomycetota bacterium]|nr:helix-turn-helix domain-containing protein [Actinomycetota bacterium]
MNRTEALDRARATRRVARLARAGVLRALREELGLSQAAVAAALGVRQPSVSRWETGKARPRPRHAVALLRLLEEAGA